ncbi:hypothetical protein H5410_016294 [Solanum commersonii]|uniref:Uncharacterized protein n=1 Tax=Solanum commersonii TaxID=4109 RepID=A0A9J5ZW04_SOLCO|nr:hypothetical protein H5410_016294 [Solanum commersonii]
MVELRRRLDRVLDISRASSYHNNGAAEDIIPITNKRSLFVLLYNGIHQGHVKLNCYKLNGYPPDWKFKKKTGLGVDQGGTSQMQGLQIIDKYLANQVRYEHDPDAFGRSFDHGDCGSATNNTNIGDQVRYGDLTMHLDLGVLATHPTFTQRQYQRIMHMLDKEESEAADNTVAKYSYGRYESNYSSFFCE